MNIFQHKEDKGSVKIIAVFYMKKFSIEFLCRWIGISRSKKNEAINALQFLWKPLKINLQKLFLIIPKCSIIFE